MALGDNFTDLAFSWGPDIQRGTQAMQQFYEDRSPLNDVQKSVVRGLGGLGDTGPSMPPPAPAPQTQAPPALSEGLGAPFNPMSQARPGPDNPPWMPSPQQAMPDSELLAVQPPPSAARPAAQAPASAPKSAADKIAVLKSPGATSGNVSVSKKGPMGLPGLDPDKMTQKDWHSLMQAMPMLQTQMKTGAKMDPADLEILKGQVKAVLQGDAQTFKGGEGDKNRAFNMGKLQAQLEAKSIEHDKDIALGYSKLNAWTRNTDKLIASRGGGDTGALLKAVKDGHDVLNHFMQTRASIAQARSKALGVLDTGSDEYKAAVKVFEDAETKANAGYAAAQTRAAELQTKLDTQLRSGGQNAPQSGTVIQQSSQSAGGAQGAVPAPQEGEERVSPKGTMVFRGGKWKWK